MKNPIIYVVLNGELKMSPGKAAAQAVHASMLLSNDARDEFVAERKRTVIVLEGENGAQLRTLYEYLSGTDLDYDYYIDEGVNEVSPYSITSLAVGPIAHDDEELREILLPFQLYGGQVTVKRFSHASFEYESVPVRHNAEIDNAFAFRALKRASK